MPPPNDFDLSSGMQINQQPDGRLCVSAQLVELLVTSRSEYDWPKGTGAEESQRRVINLETQVADWLTEADAPRAYAIVQAVSKWGGNRKKINTDSTEARAGMWSAIYRLLNVATLKDGLDALSRLPGLRLVMATKIYRFCSPNVGTAIDRHTSYFFNSLEVVSADGARRKATSFKREADGKHTTRLAAYTDSSYAHNRD